MESRDIVRISVRDLVEFVLRSGDIDSGFIGFSTAVEGTRAHRTVQRSRGEGYSSEVFLSHETEYEGIALVVDGRIDGLYENENGTVIEEIKTTSQSLDSINEDYNPVHWAQAKCYAYIYALQNSIDRIQIQLTYYHRGTGETKNFYKIMSLDELSEFFNCIIYKYLRWVKLLFHWRKVRDESIKSLDFPFETYRRGQREMAVYVYRTIASRNRLFIQAPTGIGKTMAAIFPAVKALCEGHISKIFYLTARTTVRTVAQGAFENLDQKGVKLKTITITAKEKACLNGEMKCNPRDCSYAKGYFDRLMDAVEDIFKWDHFTPELVAEYAKKHNLCPFEFSLDLSLFCDCIICDYNYVFDPRVYLKRFFARGSEEFVFLVDEAHNLVDRAREMFSAELEKKPFLELKKAVKGQNKKLYDSINDINSCFITLRKKCEEEKEGHCVKKEIFSDILPLLEKFIDECEGWVDKCPSELLKQSLLDSYFEALNYLKIADLYDEKYITYIEKQNNNVKIKMFCMDPSRLLGQAYKRGGSTVLFSATLAPMGYFSEILGGEEKNLRIRIPSPFDQSKLCLLAADNISTRYAHRESTYNRVADSIIHMASSRVGNYIAFFPSYKYMLEVYDRVGERNLNMDLIYQTPEMKESEREQFIENFKAGTSKTLIAFAVMGGVFGEGIDLVGERLSGVAIVGVGLPQICLERDLIRDHFNNENGRGFEFSYVYPGMNKVLQAAGRVIRTETDRGVVLLIDERFSAPLFKSLMPPEWSHLKFIRNQSMLNKVLTDFWNIK